jgi:diguanylate cyclase (GGDEF)-like protein
VALASLRITGRHLRRQLEQELPHAVHLLQQRYETWYDSRRLEMQAFANSAFLTTALRQLDQLPPASPERARVGADLDKYLAYLSEPLDHYEAFFLFDRRGALIAQSTDSLVFADELFQEIGPQEPGEPEILPVWFEPAAGVAHQFLLAPIRDPENQYQAFLVGAIRLEKLQEFFQDPELPLATEFILVDEAGQVVSLSHPDTLPPESRRAYTRMPLAETGNRLLEYRDLAGRRVVGAMARIRPLGWLVAEKDYQLAFAPLYTIRNRTLVLAILILIAFAILAWRGLHSLLRPVEELARAVEAISSDQLDIYLPSASRDEIGQLTRSFNRMAARLRINRLEIERTQQNLADINLRLEQANLSLAEKNDELENANLKLAKLSVTDHLTGLHNLRNLTALLDQEMARSRRTRQPLSLLMIDLDDFKQFNDEYGHPAGDALLKEIAALFQENVRQTDHIGRWGGEEFLAVLPDTDPAGAREAAEKIRQAVAQYRFRLPGIISAIQQTISIGVAALSSEDLAAITQVQFVNRADKAMYQSKRLGKNRVSVYEG